MITYNRWSRQHPSIKKTEVILKKSLLFVTRAALIGALYFALTVAIPALSFGPIQFRLSEVLVLTAVIFPEAIPGLTIGCVLSNFFFSPYGIYDMVFGGIATLLGAIGTYLLRKKIPLAAIPPVIFNAFLVPIIWVIDGSDTVYIISVLEVMAGEVLTVGAVGIPLTYALKKAFEKAGLFLRKKPQTEDDDDISTELNADCVNNDADIDTENNITKESETNTENSNETHIENEITSSNDDGTNQEVI